jgi:hypothetical protein
MSRISVASREATGQVGTYPTRNFATLGPFLLLQLGPKSKRSTHFWPTLMVAHESGLSHPILGLEDGLGV